MTADPKLFSPEAAMGKASRGDERKGPMAGPEQRLSTVAVFSLIVLLSGLIYANSLRNDFVYDDIPIIVKNKLITRLVNVPAFFTMDYWAAESASEERFEIRSGLYRPLVMVTYALNYAVGGLHPLGYRLVNIALHALVSCFLYLFALGLGFSALAALIGAVVFAVHPVHTEAVNWIVGRAELLMGLGVLGSLWWAMQGRMWLSLGAFAVGLFSKEQAAMLPGLLFLQDLYLGKFLSGRVRGKGWAGLIRTLVVRYGGYGLVLAGYLLLRSMALGRGLLRTWTPFLSNPLLGEDFYSCLLTIAKVAGKYLWLCLWPAYLSADYSYNSIPVARSSLEPGVFFSFLVWGGLVIMALWLFRRDRWVALCLGFTLITFFPVSNFSALLGRVVSGIMAERFFYLPSAGLCLLVGLGSSHCLAWARRQPEKIGHASNGSLIDRFLADSLPPRLAWVLIAGIVIGLSARTVARNRDWANNESLFWSAVRAAPDSARAQLYLGVALTEKQNWGRALEAYETALRIYPDLPSSINGFNSSYGTLLLQLGKVDEAIPYLERAVLSSPKWSTPQYNLGLAYARIGRFREAEASLRRAVALDPGRADAYNSMSRLFIEMGRFREAAEAADAAIQRNPELAWAYFNKAQALERLDQPAEAASAYQRMLAIDPTQTDARKRLQAIEKQLGKG